MEDKVVVLITAPSEDAGQDIARTLLEQKLAACVNIVSPIASIYTWEGELCSDEEVLLVIKSTRVAFEQLAAAVQNVHPYDVPEIIALPVLAGTQDYLNWIDEVVEA